jgi:hypothetical protein
VPGDCETSSEFAKKPHTMELEEEKENRDGEENEEPWTWILVPPATGPEAGVREEMKTSSMYVKVWEVGLVETS